MSLGQHAHRVDLRFCIAHGAKRRGKGHAAKNGRAETQRIAVHLRKAQKGRGIAAVHHAGLKSGRTNGLNGFHKSVKLCPRALFIIEGAVKMRVNTADGNVLFLAVEPQNALNVIRQKPKAPHAGVDLDMNLRDIRTLRRNFIDERGHFRRTNGQDHSQIDQTVDLLCILRRTKHQNLRRIKTVFTQQLGFAHFGDAKVIDAVLTQALCQRHKAEAVAVTLDHRPNLRLARLTFQKFYIMRQICRFHHIRFHIAFPYFFFLAGPRRIFRRIL